MTLFRILFYILLATVGIYSSSAQEITLEAFKTDTLDKVFLDKCIYRVYYQIEIKQDSLQNIPNRGLTLLQIGSKTSKFIDFYQHYTDSLRDETARRKNHSLAKSEVTNFQYSLYSKIIFRNQVFRNYPQKDINTIRLGTEFGEYFTYEEISPQFNWEISLNEEKNIKGYRCKKATCSYRGRIYQAWYSEDIPIPVGPYVFGGLPGLIMEIRDSNNEYVFVIMAVLLVKNYDPIYRVNTPYEFLYERDKSWHEIKKSYQNLHFEIDGKILQSETPYNPIEKD
ncbi:GLPGLI family protein [Porphyromonas sp. COT-052 OH4946]|uniref:GLPGLI family protein n=1 Tax=Porphyromonas sp. COT-052 OH4946 TaxID=1515618 RepID=UPI00051CC75C|nr:GLPGLI family protein [Porphyromonas sp. COT-052 OH4946]KGL56223.1 GLPGLI family protein [Porphyromonas sp. COT-052 OH4946]